MSDIQCRIDGRAGRVTLNRPQALNALTHDMCLDLERALLAWRDDPQVGHVVIDGAGARAFCAGGDITRLYEAGLEHDAEYGRRFWRDEYRLNALIHDYPKPYIAIMHGFVMGGGVGVAAHGSHRIVTDTTRLAMPECGIGLVPDVGGSLLLAQAPGYLGECLGLTGHRMTAADSLYAGFADAYVPEDRIAALISDLVASNVANVEDAVGEHIAAIIARHAESAGDSMLAAHIDDINAVFGASDVITIRSRLDAHDVLSAAFPRMAGGMAAGSPIALAATAALVQAVRAAPTMETALDMEYRFTHRWLESTDFIEGIRAAVIDKDHAPRWRHDDVAAVPAALIEGLLAPLD